MVRETPVTKSSGILTIASACIVVAALYLARDFLVPVAVAILLAFLLGPLVSGVERLHLPRGPAVIIVVFLTFVIIGGVGWLIYYQIEDFAAKITSYEGQIHEQIESLRHRLSGGALTKIPEEFNKVAEEVASSRPTTASAARPGTPENPVSVDVQSMSTPSQSALNGIGTALAIVTPTAQTLIIVVLVIFILLQREDLRDRLIRLIGHNQLTVTTQALDDAAKRISRYLLRQTLINSSIGVVIGVGLFLLGIPDAPLWGLLCGLLRFVPYVGIWLGAAFPILLSLVVHPDHSVKWPLLTIGMFGAIELGTGNFIEPYIYGASTGVSSLAILVAVVFWTWLWGGIGLLLSTPLTVILVVLGKYVPRMEFLGVLLGDQPVLQPYERYYQRLLADDSEEAEDLLDEGEKSQSTEQIYTEILLPALQLARADQRRGVLESHRLDFILEELKDYIEVRRTRDQIKRQDIAKQPSQTHDEAEASQAGETSKSEFSIPHGNTINVLCVPASDEADEIVGLMLAHLLEEKGYATHCLTAATLASEMVESVASVKADVIAISALPPNAIAHARYLCMRLKGRFPDFPMMIGVWKPEGDQVKLQRRICDGPAVQVTTNLSAAVSEIHQMIQPVLLRQNNDQNEK